MTEATLRVALPKLFLWSEPGRIQEYPEALARAEPGRIYSRLEVERELFDIAPTLTFQGGAPRGRQTDGVINTYGLERSGQRYRINGINLLERVDEGLRASLEGLALGRSFRDEGPNANWPRLLARQILRREPRVRLVVGLCLDGWQLDVEAQGGIPSGTLSLTSPDGEALVIPKRHGETFNQLLQTHADLALGPFWRTELSALGAMGAPVWEGVQGDRPSTNDLTTALKKALTVLFHVHAFEGGPRTWSLDPRGLVDALGLQDLSEVGFEDKTSRILLTEDEAFAQAVSDCADADGYLIASQLAHRFGEILGIERDDRGQALDRFARAAIYHERLRILDRHAGQPRMGRGLFGEPESRRIRLDFTPVTVDDH